MGIPTGVRTWHRAGRGSANADLESSRSRKWPGGSNPSRSAETPSSDSMRSAAVPAVTIPSSASVPVRIRAALANVPSPGMQPMGDNHPTLWP